MKAVLCKEYGPPDSLVLAEVDPLKPGKGQVVISVQACGVNFPDTLIIQGKSQFKPDMPFTQGSEIRGRGKEVGEGVEHVQVGEHVIAFTGWGGFAEEVAADATKLIKMPAGMDFVTAAAFTLVYGTSHHALKDRAQIKPGETLLVLGAAGGVGLSAVELGEVMGAHVIAAASSAEKLAVCQQHGADELINYSTEDLKERVKALTRGKGVNVIFDLLGGNYSKAALRTIPCIVPILVIRFAPCYIPSCP